MLRLAGDRTGAGDDSGFANGPASRGSGIEGRVGDVECANNGGSSGIMGELVGGRSSPSSSPVNLQVLPGVDGSSTSSRLGTTIAGGSSAVEVEAAPPELNSRSNSDAQSLGVSGSCRIC